MSDLGVAIISFQLLAWRAPLVSAQCNDPLVNGVNELIGELIRIVPREWMSPLLAVMAVPECALSQDARPT
jgi:hypothetical protein